MRRQILYPWEQLWAPVLLPVLCLCWPVVFLSGTLPVRDTRGNGNCNACIDFLIPINKLGSNKRRERA